MHRCSLTEGFRTLPEARHGGNGAAVRINDGIVSNDGLNFLYVAGGYSAGIGAPIWRFIRFGPILSLNVLSVLAILHCARTHGIR